MDIGVVFIECFIFYYVLLICLNSYRFFICVFKFKICYVYIIIVLFVKVLNFYCFWMYKWFSVYNECINDFSVYNVSLIDILII